MCDYINWGFSELPFEIKGRCKYLKSLPSLTIDEQFELIDVEDRCIKIQEKEDAQDERDKAYYLYQKELKEQQEKEEQIRAIKHIQLCKENENTKAVFTKSFVNYVTALADDVDKKFDNTINLRFLKDVIEQIKKYKPSYGIKIVTTDSDFDAKYRRLTVINNNRYISEENFYTGVITFINTIIDKLELQDEQFEISYKQTHKIQKNDWANNEVICEHCNKTYLKSNKTRHFATKVCQKSRI